MAQLNTKTYVPPPITHEGTIAARTTPLQELLWPPNHQEDMQCYYDDLRKKYTLTYPDHYNPSSAQKAATPSSDPKHDSLVLLLL